MAKKARSIPKPEMVGWSDNVFVYQAALYCEDDGNLLRWELDKKGKTPDLDYDFDSVQHVNTVRAHELIHFAKVNGRQLEAKERLLKAYFVEGQDLSDIEVLADLAAELGLDRAAAVHALEERVHHDDVLADQQQAQAYGIQGVPFFVIDGKYGVSGAQEAATFADVLTKITSDREEATE